MNTEDVLFGIICILVFVVINGAFFAERINKERLFIIRHHCPVIDEATGTFKCANGKVYVLGDE